MFFLGVLVGRGTAPVQFDIEALQKELTELRAAYRENERQQVSVHRQPLGGLGFYEDLKRSDPYQEERKAAKQAAAGPASPPPAEPARPAPGTDPPAQAAPIVQDAPAKPPEPPVREPKAAVAASEPEKGALAIQVASVKDSRAAEETAAKLIRRGYPASVVRVEIPNRGTWYRVQVGRFTDRREASATLSRLREDRYEGVLVPRTR